MGYDRFYGEPMWGLIRSKVGAPVTTAIEVGTFQGHWARGFLDNIGVTKHLYCIDPWGKTGFNRASAAWFEVLGPYALEHAIPLRGTSAEWARVVQIVPEVIFIDGDHTHDGVLLDLQLWWPKLKDGGIMVMHDAGDAGVAKAIDDYFGPGNTAEEALGPMGRPNCRARWKVKC